MSLEPFLDNEIIEILQLIENDKKQGMSKLKSLALSGNASATLYYALSLGDEEDECEIEEIAWLMKAESLGFSDAAWNLAMIANKNHNDIDFKRWIDRAAELESVEANCLINMGYNIKQYLASLQ